MASSVRMQYLQVWKSEACQWMDEQGSCSEGNSWCFLYFETDHVTLHKQLKSNKTTMASTAADSLQS